MSTKQAYNFSAKEAQYRSYTLTGLLFSVRDAREAADAMRGHDPAAESWYLDDMATISMEINRRKGVFA